MAQIVLATSNARYIHTALGLRYLKANLGDLSSNCVILEGVIKEGAKPLIDRILAEKPKIVGLSVYIWNVEVMREVLGELKARAPKTKVVVGGPEVSYEIDQQPWLNQADAIILGEGEKPFAELCQRWLRHGLLTQRVFPSQTMVLNELVLPYDEFTDEDLAHRVLYVEASRGCPFRCEFCLSSLDKSVRLFPLDDFLKAMDRLWQRGARHFKFVDRTFNLNIKTSRKILHFFLERYEKGTFLHFEMIPDRLPPALKDLIKCFPPGALQFEIGVQTFNPEVGQHISRRQDLKKLEDNFRFLRHETGVHVHADLIVGLPGENLESFQRGFDRLFALNPQEIQVGILKRLKGTPISRHDGPWGMKYNPKPPFEILESAVLGEPEINRMKVFSRFYDIYVNSGRFRSTLPLLFVGPSPFENFIHFSDWLFEKTGQTHGHALDQRAQWLMEYLLLFRSVTPESLKERLREDLLRTGQMRLPRFLKTRHREPRPNPHKRRPNIPDRQDRHL